jgi:hypothetical protein
MRHLQKHVLMAAAGVALSSGGARAGAATETLKIGIPTDEEELKKFYAAQKTGVPFNEALDFTMFLDAVLGGTFFGTKYAAKFCNDDNKIAASQIWIRTMELTYAGKKRRVYIELGEKGNKVCNAMYGEGNGPHPYKGSEKPSKGYKLYGQRRDADSIESDFVPLKSGGGDF